MLRSAGAATPGAIWGLCVYEIKSKLVITEAKAREREGIGAYLSIVLDAVLQRPWRHLGCMLEPMF